MKAAIAFVLLATIVSSSFIENKLRRNVADELEAFNTQDFITGFLLAMRLIEKVPDV
jgi:hypothetical protein